MESFVVHSAPLHVGVVFAVNSSSSVSGLDDAGVAVLCAYNYVSQYKNQKSALNFLQQVLVL